MGLQHFERRLERLVEGAFAKAFRSGLQPVELGRRLTREMDARRAHGVRGVVVPNAFTFALSPSDYGRFSSFRDMLKRDLVDAAKEHANREGQSFVGPVTVELTTDPSLTPGVFLVSGEMRGLAAETSNGFRMATVSLPDGRRAVVGDRPLRIGRMSDCDIVLADPNASRLHAEVRRAGDRYVLVDLGSTNGTRVNGTTVRERELADGDIIAIGSSTLHFEAA